MIKKIYDEKAWDLKLPEELKPYTQKIIDGLDLLGYEAGELRISKESEYGSIPLLFILDGHWRELWFKNS
jgi:hypothetical protein